MIIKIELNENITKKDLEEIHNKLIKLSYSNKKIKKVSTIYKPFELLIYPYNYTNKFLKKIGVLNKIKNECTIIKGV